MKRNLTEIRPRRGAACALALFFALCCFSPSPSSASALAELIAALETSERMDSDKVAAVYRETVTSGAGIDRAVARLRAYARAAPLSPEARAACHLAIAQLQWRDGAIEEAVLSSEKALESALTPEALLLKARLLDTGGEQDSARDWYRRAAEEFGEGDEQWMIRLRLAMMDVNASNVQALEELVREGSQENRNQAAVVLALLGRPERAIALYQPSPASGKLFQQNLRLSEWALEAGEHGKAREQAWLAYERASVRADRMYALSLLAESYRVAGELSGLLEDLVARGADDQDLLRLRVETLIEIEAYSEAIELYEQLEDSGADVAERRRLVALYEAAGDTAAMVREYRRMMDAEPAQVQWYDGLAAHYLNLADNDAALAVWEIFEARNAPRAGVLVEGAQLMLQMGFVSESVAMIERRLANGGPDFGALLFLFETWLNRGEDEPALEALVRMEAYLPPDAAELRDLADAYERLSRPQEALRVFEAIAETRGELGYDDQMRLAWLYTLVDRKPEALALWQDIWVGAQSPARRSFAESQLLLLAAELGALGDMAVELEGRLIAGTASRDHMNLLVRIYTEVGDKLSATEIIDEFARGLGEDEVGHQTLLAHVYMLLEDYPAHDRALRRLYEIDTANRVDHVKSIIINLLTFDLAAGTNERYEEIQRWIGELRKLDEESVTGEFEASILAMAGFTDAAVDAYRRALVEQPENSDNLLLLADVMDSDNRTEEAVAILQFFAENAVEDNDFVVAVDGILNLIGTTTFFQQPNPDTLNTLEWTRRVILERIAGSSTPRFYLYELLADIAGEQQDTEASFVALENSLAEAGLRRPAVLRELLTMATPNAGFGGFNTGAGDIERQLRHGRRLVGLRQQLPPEVYVDVGKSLLAREDVAGAERAFEMIDDITGLIDIDRTKAEIFEEAGYAERSREFYNRALNVNRDSLDLLHKTGLLYEAIGREDVAFQRYLQAIVDILRRQSAVLAAGARPVDPNSWQAITEQRTDNTVTREYREHYASLEQGLLLSWPDDAGESAAAAAQLKTVFDTELRNVLERAGGNLLPLARYARLDRSARLVRRVGFFLNDPDLARYADRKLLDHFGADADFADHLLQAYQLVGWPLPKGLKADEALSALMAGSPLRYQLALAERQEDFETRLQLLRLAGAYDEMEALLGERILDGDFREGLGYALGWLGRREFRRLARATAPRWLEHPDKLIALINRDVNLLLDAEQAAGGPLAPPEQTIALLLEPGADGQLATPFVFGLSGARGQWEYLKAHGGIEDRIRYFKAQAALPHNDQTMYSGPEFLAFYRELLAGELTDAQRAEIVAAVTENLSRLETNSDGANVALVQAMLVPGALAENAGAIYEITRYIEQRWANFPSGRPLMEALVAGREIEAYRRLVEFEERMPTQDGFPSRVFVSGLEDAVSGARSEILRRIVDGEPVELELARSAYQREFSFWFSFRRPSDERDRRKAEVLEKLIAIDPDPSRYTADQINAWLSAGYADRAGAAIAREFSAAPQNEAWRLAWLLFLKSQQRFEEALAVATGGETDLRSDAAVQQALARLTGRGISPISGILQQLQAMQVQGSSSAQSPRVASAAIMPLGAPGSLRVAGPVQRLNEALHAEDHEAGRQALREAWRSLLAPRDSPYGMPFGAMPLLSLASGLMNTPMTPPGQGAAMAAGMALPIGGGFALAPAMRLRPGAGNGEDDSEPSLLFDAVAKAPYGAAELEGFLRAMPDRQRRGFHPLYGYLAKAAGEAQRLEELGGRLISGTLNDHEFTLWMLLREQQKAEFGPGGLEAFERRLAALADPSPYQMLLAARVYASAGAIGPAVQRYKLVAARRIQHDEFGGQQRIYFGPTVEESGVADLSELVGEVAVRLPPEAAREVLEAILLLARPARASEGASHLFDAFLLATLEQTYPPGEVLIQARRRSDGILEIPEMLAGTGAAKAAELLRAYARAGDLESATEILGSMLLETGPGPLSQEDAMDMQRQMDMQFSMSLSLLYGIFARVNPWDQGDAEVAGVWEITDRLDRLFPKEPEGWDGLENWLEAATNALLDRLAGGEAHQDETINLIASLAERAAADAAEPGENAEMLSRILASVKESGRPLSASALDSLVELAVAEQSRLPFEWVSEQLRAGSLPWRQRLILAAMFEQSEEDGPRMLELLREAGLDRGLGMLRVLHGMAQRWGDAQYADDLQQRLDREQAAEQAMATQEDDITQATAMSAL